MEDLETFNDIDQAPKQSYVRENDTGNLDYRLSQISEKDENESNYLDPGGSTRDNRQSKDIDEISKSSSSSSDNLSNEGEE